MIRRISKSVILFSSTLMLVMGLVTIISPAPAVDAASAGATGFCKRFSGASQTACEQGFDNAPNHDNKGATGESVSSACQAYAGDNLSDAQQQILTACQTGWGRGAHEDPAVYCSQSQCDFVGKYINPAIDLFSLSFGLIAVISLIIGGIQYSASQGDPQKTAAAKNRISNTILAIFIYLFLFSFLQFLIPGGVFH